MTPTTNTSNLSIAYLDFDTIKASLRDYLRSQTVFKDYNFEGAGLSVLLDILAYNTYYFGFYMNMIANEMFIDSASLRSSVVSLAKMVDYTPRSITSSQAQISITITPNDDSAAAVIQQNTTFTTNVDGTTFSFVTDQAYGATIQNGQYIFPNVTLTEGIPYTYRITVDPTIPNQTFVLPNPNVDTSTLTVQVQTSFTNTATTTFSLADNLLTIEATTPAYFLQEVANEQFQIVFGDGVIGQALVAGNIVILNYLMSQGDLSNAANFFTPSTPVAGYPAHQTTITTLVPAAGGMASETVAEIKFAAPKNYEAQQRAVTTSDYSLLVTQNYPNAQSVAVWGGEDETPPQYGQVFVSIKPVDGFVITETAKQTIISNILRQYNMVSVIPQIVDPDYTFVIVNCNVKYNPAVTSETVGDIQSAAYTAIVTFAQANIDQFDLELRYSRLLAAIDNSDSSITNNLTSVQMKKMFTPGLSIPTNYTFTLNNPILPGSLTSTPFIVTTDPLLLIPYVNGNTYTIQDDSLGNLQMYQQGIGIATVIVRSCGTINYTTGQIMLTEFLPFSADVNGEVSLIMTPQQNDIIPVRNNIIYINPSDITVTAIPNTPLQV